MSWSALGQQLRVLLSGLLSALLDAQPIGWFAIGLIVIALAYALILLSQGMKQIKLERLALQEAQRYLLHLREDTEDDELHVSTETIIEGISQDHIAGQAVSALWQSRRLPSIGLESILTLGNTVVLSHLSRLRAIPNSILLIGLFGTVAGLAFTIASLAPQLRDSLFASDPAQLTQGLSFTLQEMQTAFAATLWGIVGALLALPIAQKFAVSRNQLIVEYRRFVIEVAAPRILPENVAAQLQDIRQVLEQSFSQLSNVTEIMNSAADRFEGVLTQTGTQMNESIANLSEVSESMHTSLSSLSKSVHDSANSLLVSTQGMQSSADSLKEFHGQMRDAYTQMNTLFIESQDRADERSSDQLRRIDGLGSDFVATATDIMNSNREVSARLEGAVDAFEANGVQNQQLMGETSNAIAAGFRSLNEGLESNLENHLKQVEALAVNLTAFQTALTTLHDDLGSAHVIRQEKYDQLNSMLNELMAALPQIIPNPALLASLNNSLGQLIGTGERASDLGQISFLVEQLQLSVEKILAKLPTNPGPGGEANQPGALASRIFGRPQVK